MAERRGRRAPTVWTTGSRLRKLVLMCWVILLAFSLTALASTQRQWENIRQLTLISGPAKSANDEVHQAMTDAQAGLIGYQLSGDRALLEPYFGARARTTTALATLQDKLALGAAEGGGAAKENLDLGTRQQVEAEKWWANALRVEQALSRGERTDLFESRALFRRFLGANDVLGDRLSTALVRARLEAQSQVTQGQAISVAVALVALVAMLVLGRRVARTISLPLTELRDTVVRQRQGEGGARAQEDRGSSEVRSVAAHFNALTEQNLALQHTQALALGGHRITSDIGRAMRAASDTQEALDVVCTELGAGLGADRVIGHTFDVDHMVLLGAQWHRPDLTPVEDLTLLQDLGELGELAEELWLSHECRTRDDLLEAELQGREQVRSFCEATGARASIMVPIGFGDRVIGMIYVLMVRGPRTWSTAETNVAQAVAGFVARAIVEAENQAHRREYVHKVEMLDRQKSDFLATVSHELRTPLTSITGYVELLQDGEVGELTTEQKRMLEVINRSTARLRTLIEDVMTLSRIEGGVSKSKFAEVSVGALITHVVEELGPLASSRAIELEVDVGPEGAVVMGDKASLDRAVVNILSNAIKFSHEGGVVTINSVLDQEAHRVLIICQDHGVGIPAQDHGELFTRFFRASNATDQSIPGTGLGLSICKQIVEDHHGGQLRLISIEGEGTTVVIDLPLHEPPQPPHMIGNDSHSADVFDIRV